MKRLTLAALLAALTAHGALAALPTTLKVGIDGNFPPYSEVAPDGSLKGFDIDIANALCAQMQVKCEIRRHEFDGMIPALVGKKLDMIVASMAITDERKKVIAFSDKYEGGYQMFFAPKGAKLTLTPAGLKGKRIGVQRGSIQESYMKAVFAPAGVDVASYEDTVAALGDLRLQRLDALFLEIGNAAGFLAQPENAGFATLGPRFNDEKYFGTGSGVAVRKQDNALRQAINAAIKTIRANGTYKKINDKYFSYDQYE